MDLNSARAVLATSTSMSLHAESKDPEPQGESIKGSLEKARDLLDEMKAVQELENVILETPVLEDEEPPLFKAAQ
jgi:hypothetical protein